MLWKLQRKTLSPVLFIVVETLKLQHLPPDSLQRSFLWTERCLSSEPLQPFSVSLSPALSYTVNIWRSSG